jgi:hypothetical protein
MERSGLRALPAFLCIVALIPGGSARKSGGRTMDKKSELADKFLALPEERYFDYDSELEESLTERLADEDSFYGLLLGAPPRIDLARRKELPLLLLARTSGQRDWEVRFTRNATLIAVDLDEGTIRRRHAFQSSKRRTPAQTPGSMQGPPPNGDEARSVSSYAELLGARSLLGLPWHAARYALTVIDYDWVSNTVVTRLEVREGWPTEPLFFPAERAAELGARAGAGTTASDELPAFVRSTASPKLDAEGIAISVPAEVKPGAGRIPVLGTLRVKLPPGAIVAFPASEKPAVELASSRLEQLPRAVLRTTLLLVRKDVVDPPRVDLEVPVFQKEPVKEGDPANAYFAIDLARHVPEPLSPGEYLVYAIVGPYLAGPHRMVVSSETR